MYKELNEFQIKSLAATKPEIAKLEVEEAISATELFFRQMDTVQCLAVESPLLVCGLHNGEVLRSTDLRSHCIRL